MFGVCNLRTSLVYSWLTVVALGLGWFVMLLVVVFVINLVFACVCLTLVNVLLIAI